ncbi:MAG: CHASE2 domain-containing protein [Cyanobacteriota bacterium]|nr:CHASE2 domain-containing protein [Cyanobacteriota bacterium]
MFNSPSPNVRKLAILNLGPGNLETGFPAVTVQLSANEGSESDRLRRLMQTVGSLPPAPELSDLYRKWQLLYSLMSERFRTLTEVPQMRELEFEESEITHVSEADLSQLGREFQEALNRWLDSDTFRPIDRQLRRVLHASDEIRLIVETDDLWLRRLPWHLWNFFEDYPRAEMALGVPDYEPVRPRSRTPKGIVRILAILGNSTGIDIEADRRLLAALPDAEVVFLEEPNRRELDEHLWEEKGWDILFFAGHSHSREETGRISINPTQSLTLAQLKNALKTAVDRGLQLAIFNSCDGLALARALEDLHVPHIAVMRESVVDRVAQDFLRHFLRAFAKGESFYLAVREARERLQRLEDEYPGASWLPVICQNPATGQPSWRKLRGRSRPQLVVPSIASIAATALVVGLSSLGMLQGWEFREYDRLMRARPAEAPDPRMLVVTATEADVQKYGFPIPDGILAETIAKLETHQPRTVALDILRDRPVEPGHEDLVRQFKTHTPIGICSAREANNPNKPGVAPPPDLPADRLGYSDTIVDPDGILRRHLVFMQPGATDPCATDFSLAAIAAIDYLEKDGILPKTLSANEVTIGQTSLTRLQSHDGGYAGMNDWGFQIMLNYRSDVARQVSFSEILEGNFDPAWVEDRLVLMGVTAPISSDYFLTPYSARDWPYTKMPGVLVQAQAISQILSSTLDGRPLMQTWGLGGDVLWILGWAIAGGAIACSFRRSIVAIAIVGGAVGILYGACFVLLLQGRWVPLVPSVLALVATSGGILVVGAIRDR